MSSHHQGNHNRRAFLAIASGLASAAVATRVLGQSPSNAPSSAPPRDITVYKDANCGCCAEWVKHIKKAGFIATVHDTADMASVKSGFGVPGALQSCHTARIGQYTIEGHVPADVITRLLKELPKGRGLAVPGMPMGSPGMEGSRKEAFDVLLFDVAGKTRVFASR